MSNLTPWDCDILLSYNKAKKEFNIMTVRRVIVNYLWKLFQGPQKSPDVFNISPLPLHLPLLPLSFQTPPRASPGGPVVCTQTLSQHC